MKKLKQITVMGVLGFLLLQAAKATGLQQNLAGALVLNDTLVKNDTLLEQERVNDPKLGFKNLFTTAVTGDGTEGARLNPMAVTFVRNYIAKNGKGFLKMKEWGKGYLSMMDEVLTKHGLPGELKYIAVIESGLKLNAGSRSGAIGPWAFMPAAAKQYGLRTGKNDERLDYYKSTHAAARLLTDLYQRYGDWLLVIAAYNSGPGNVDKAIWRAGGSKDFWTIQHYLPNETMNHVKKFIGTHYIFEGEGGVTTLTKKETKDLVINNPAALDKDEMDNSTVHPISGRFHAAVITRHIGLDMETFNRYNPGFEQAIALNGKYDLRLPTQKMNIFVSRRYEILEESVQTLLKSAEGVK